MTPYSLCLTLLFMLWPSYCIQDLERRHAMSNILDPKISGGLDAPKGRFPYMCSLRKRGSQGHMCGGTLIEKTWVLTAAHCLTIKEGRALGYYPIVDCGIYHVDIVADHQTFAAIDSHVHPEWTGQVDDGFDIALLKLNREADLITPRIDKKGIQLVQGDYLSAIGWGTTQTADIADVLQIAQRLVYIPQETCERVLDMKLKEHMICAGMLDQDTCRGDSGGPLFVASAPKGKVKKGLPALDLIVGITSAGYQKEQDGTVVCDSTTPGVYTNVSFFWDWISEIIEDDRETVGQGRLWKKEAKELRELYRPLSDDELLLEMIHALQADDPLKADSLLLAGVSANSRYENYTILSDIAPGSTLLHWAAAYDSIQCVKILLLARAELDALNIMGETSLYTAASYGSSKVTKYLLESGADKDRASLNGMTPLHVAAWHGHYPVVKILVEEGADLEPKDNAKQTPLHLAAINGNVKIVKKLISNNVAVDVQNNHGKTPLMLAAEGGNLKAAKVLIRAGANASAVDNDGWSPLLFASWRGHLEIVKELVSHSVDIESRNKEGTTALMEAAEEGHLEIAKVLLAHGANVNATNNLGKTPLHFAARKGDAEVLKVLLLEGANVHAKTHAGRTPLIEASSNGHFEAVKELLAYDADPNAADNSGVCPLLEASKYGHLDIVQVLKESGANVNATDLRGRSALSLAASAGKVDVVKALLSYGVDMDAATKPGGATALHEACAYRRVEVIKVLVENGVDINKVDDEGRTALHIASQRGYLEAAEALVEGGADKTIEDSDSKTAVDVVCSYAYAYCSVETKAALEKLLAF